MNQTQLDKAIVYNAKEEYDGDLKPAHIVRMAQFWQEHHDLNDDGKAGPQTQKSVDNSIDTVWDLEDPEEPEEPCPSEEWPVWDGPGESQPASGEQKGYFGDPETSKGSNVMSRNWYRDNIIECHESLGNRLPGIPARWYIKVHWMVEPYLREALRRCAITCPDYVIERLGNYHFRHIQNNPSKPLSMHSFGVAFDVNSADNGVERYSRGGAPAAYSPEYMARWPNGVPAEFVQCFTSCGFAWGSDWNEDGRTEDHTFLDPMHFEWVARDGVKTQV